MGKSDLKIAFITCIFGSLNKSIPGPFKKFKKFDYFLFTDNKKHEFKSSWTVINLSGNFKIKNLKCPIRKSRYAKFLGWELLNSKSTKYDYIFYCDCHWSPNHEADFECLVSVLNENKFTLCQDLHVNKDIQRGGIITECEFIIKCYKDSKYNIKKTIDFIKERFPETKLNYPLYYQNTILGYNPNDSIYQNLSSEFWEIYTTKDITYRDQPLWNSMLQNKNLIPSYEIELYKNYFSITGKHAWNKYIN